MRRLLREQDGVVSRDQVLDAGAGDQDLRRWVRRRELARLHPGVYVDHTGPPTFRQRAWGAVLATAPSALSHETALWAHGAWPRPDESVVHVAVDHRRRIAAPEGVRVHRISDLDRQVRWHAAPPRVRLEPAVLAVVAEAGDAVGALAVVGAAVQSRRTTAARLGAELRLRERLRHGVFLRGVLDDVAAGCCSVLEHGYLTLVERAHGLSGGRRQVRDRTAIGTVYRDVEYANGLIVELDGRLHHDSAAARDADFDRDLVAAASGRRSVRLTYGQVFTRSCVTAGRIGVLSEQVAGVCSAGCALAGRISVT